MRERFRAAIFDVDGVLVDSPHERAWRETLRELMDTSWTDVVSSTTYAPERFTSGVYQTVVAGKPRLSGARAALDHFDVPDAGVRAEAYAARKQQKVMELIAAGEFTAFPDAMRFVLAVPDRGIRVAAASSSKNAGLMLGQIRLDTFAAQQGLDYEALRPGLTLRDVFDVDISGRDFARGKPDPEIFTTAGQELGVPPRECFVVEDAVAGIQAARAGGMAALAVARGDDAELLTAAGADLVVSTLDAVALDALAEGRLAIRSNSTP
jgi:beta-phosphoglucomutase-like phosphatase (HAD superfamily)